MDYGAVMTGAQFCNVSSEDGSISLNNLVPVADSSIDTAYSIIIQLLDDAGSTTDADYTWDGEKWTDTNTGAEVKDVTFGVGQGLWVYNFTGEDVKLQSAGQVITSDIDVPLSLDYGAVAVGNCFPVPVSLNDLVPLADEAVDTSYSVIIQILDDSGSTTDADYTWDGEKWTNTNTGAEVTDVSFAAGQGLWVYNFTGELVNLRIPAPEL